MTRQHDDEDDDSPFYLPLDAQSDIGRALQDGRRRRRDSETHPWDDSEPIPVLPSKEVARVSDGGRGGISDRARAATNLKVDGFTYQEIADLLEYEDAKTAKREVEKTLALTHSADDYETLRIIASARAEQQLRRSTAFAAADYLVVKGENGEDVKVPNERKLAWHQQAGTDLMNWATITGAKAPAKMEISPDLDVLDALVSKIALAAGHEDILDADVIDLDVIPPAPEPEFEGDEPDEPV